ncbi:MAG: signal peptidase I [Planctomycetota bacterium]
MTEQVPFPPLTDPEPSEVFFPPERDEAAPPQPPPGRRHVVLEAIKDNIEAFTIALILALTIKHFCVEAFKIPTESMWPTLHGEHDTGVGDRILVDKWSYLLSGPGRWDVVVFRFPLNKSKHFIKRLASPGNEWIRIENGDLWVRPTKEDAWRIATKRRRVREKVYRRVFPPEDGGDGPARAAGGDTYWEAEAGWTVETPTRLAHRGSARSSARFLERIGSQTSAHGDGGWVGGWGSGDIVQDARFLFRIVPEAGASFELRWKTAEEHETVLRLAAEGDARGSSVRTRRPGRSTQEALAARLVPGRPVEVELECVDGEVWLHLDGKVVARLDEERPIDEIRAFDDFTQQLEFTAEGGNLGVEAVRIDRDLYYADDGMYALTPSENGLFVPESSYFMLGDNTYSSHDSRKWELTHVPLRGGGEIVYYNDPRDPPVRHPDGRTTVVDEDGIERTWGPADLDPATRVYTERAPLVDRRLVVGRAFLVFWPLFPHPPARAGFIH